MVNLKISHIGRPQHCADHCWPYTVSVRKLPMQLYCMHLNARYSLSTRTRNEYSAAWAWWKIIQITSLCEIFSKTTSNQMLHYLVNSMLILWNTQKMYVKCSLAAGDVYYAAGADFIVNRSCHASISGYYYSKIIVNKRALATGSIRVRYNTVTSKTR